MTDIKSALNNNRSRVATALTAVLTSAVYIVGDLMSLDETTKAAISASVIAPMVAYIIGNGKYESQKLVSDHIPPPPR